MAVIYNIIFLLYALVSLPVLAVKGKLHRGLWMRLGFLAQELKFNNPIWIHAVSVGEVMAMRAFILKLKSAYPNKEIIISTVTATGNKVARQIVSVDKVIYLPLDFSFSVERFIQRIKPALLVVAETELWPNLIQGFWRHKIPVAVVNARISDRSFGRYQIMRFFFKAILRKISIFCAQTDLDAWRLEQIGVGKDKIKVTGNLKFDVEIKQSSGQEVYLRQALGIKSGVPVLVAASTHPGEEEQLLRVYQKLLPDFSSLRLVIAPRHPERSSEVKRIVEKKGLSAQLISKMDKPKGAKEILILDTIGKLMDYYAISDVVFMGGSLTKNGGHNILEPAILGKPVLFGPFMFNFRGIAKLFLDKEAVIGVANEDQLVASLKDLLSYPQKALSLGEKAKQLVLAGRGAAENNLRVIKDYL
ncbi:MAG: 3-deoxy-D-manno-octulosonic acid transferase [Candidatus Omnitrophica bacterium]|jgi:3-deoxy-D-manno-octulosonic-acid transferase|nr:3-deoxy-D-manno-octulosonic acid transferase [Candidatus Omnitrophota bacterium]